jgi:hypothetical protein
MEISTALAGCTPIALLLPIASPALWLWHSKYSYCLLSKSTQATANIMIKKLDLEVLFALLRITKLNLILFYLFYSHRKLFVNFLLPPLSKGSHCGLGVPPSRASGVSPQGSQVA